MRSGSRLFWLCLVVVFLASGPTRPALADAWTHTDGIAMEFVLIPAGSLMTGAGERHEESN
jgi:formylglycine-generating enzyme required for sulfatase activity